MKKLMELFGPDKPVWTFKSGKKITRKHTAISILCFFVLVFGVIGVMEH
ncbi:hypothetical protein FACS1894192_01600 [Bacilli bacterium]|nr:hypothetical protein FACS1894192_01600 [Bacilli bacterium]